MSWNLSRKVTFQSKLWVGSNKTDYNSTDNESKSVTHSVIPDSLWPMDCSLPGSSVHGILQARYWSGLPFSSLGDHPDPGIKPRSPTLQVDSSLFEPPGKHNAVLLNVEDQLYGTVGCLIYTSMDYVRQRMFINMSFYSNFGN